MQSYIGLLCVGEMWPSRDFIDELMTEWCSNKSQLTVSTRQGWMFIWTPSIIIINRKYINYKFNNYFLDQVRELIS